MTFTSSGLLDEVGTRAAAVATAAIVAAANTTVTDTAAASVAAAATAGGAYTAPLAATALSKALVASTSAAAAASAAATINSSPSAAALATLAKTTAATAANSAAAYAASAALVVDGATGTTAAALAVTAANDAVLAQAAAVNYNAAVAALAGTTQVTKVDFGAIDLSSIDPNISVDPMAFDIDFFGSTQFATPFSVNGLDQDGLPAGNLTGIDVDDTGVVFARYSNGGSKALGQVALARFQSNQSLAKLGDTSWAQTSSSGAPIYGAAGDNNFGGIQASALEGSNVDLSEQLVKLIIAQQAYQANSQTITTEKTLIQTILNA
jgi:flagellar hook protein FlgE